MTTLTNWISPAWMHSLGWALLHFIWQGTAIAALASVLMASCRRAPTRYALAVGALVIMSAAPVVTLFSLAASRTAAPVGSFSHSVSEGQRLASDGVVTMHLSPLAQLSPSLDALPWLVEAWLLGVAFFSLRSAGGFLLLERERRRKSLTVNGRILAICEAMQQRLGINRVIRYCECAWLQAPAVIGWFRPMVLLPVTTLSGLSEEQLRSIVAHELAHIRRYDAFVNSFQIAVEGVLFYHPAVWWLNQRIRAEREHCCDDVAVSVCGNPVEYARALTLMEEWRGAPALAMAANRGPLPERIRRVLGVKSVNSASRRLGLLGSMLCLMAALLAGNALLGIAYPKVHAGAASMAQGSLAHFAWTSSPAQSSAPSSQPSSPEPASVSERAQSSTKPSPGRSPSASQATTGGSYIDGIKAAGMGDFTVDQLIAMKIQGVTPEYIRGLHEQGVHLDADAIVAMKIQGVTPEYVRDLQALGLKPNTDQIVAMKIQGVTPEYVRGLKDAGLNPGVDQIIAMKIQGVTPDYLRGMHEEGLQPTADQLVGMRIQGVTPDYVRGIQALDLKPTVDEFVSMRIQGVTAEYIKDLQSAGFKFSVDEVIAARIQQIDKEFIDKAAKHGFKNLSLEQLIRLKNLGILDSPAEI
jgi:beta-lactamase regulating signal transducer with metallopeptidase domain